MHIPDGFVGATLNVAGAGVSAAAVGVALWRTGRTLEDRQIPMLGLTAAFIFAAQMLNFPVAGGTSGHFLGAMLAATLVGPLGACLALALVLLVQCLGFADGGLTALGTNIMNMGVVGVAVGWLVQRVALWVAPRGRGAFLTATALGAWFSVMAASAACALELAFSGTADFRLTLGAMLSVHAVIGVGEALITTAVLSVVLSARPDLVGAFAWQGSGAGSEEA